MSAALKLPGRGDELFFERHARPPEAPLAELQIVRLRVAVETDEGVEVPANATGTIVAVWKAGAAYEVEFVSPVEGLATVKADDLCAV